MLWRRPTFFYACTPRVVVYYYYADVQQHKDIDNNDKPPPQQRGGYNNIRETRARGRAQNDDYYPAGTTKGTGGDAIILEEAAYVDQGFFYETVAPLLLIGVTSLICISTLTSDIK